MFAGVSSDFGRDYGKGNKMKPTTGIAERCVLFHITPPPPRHKTERPLKRFPYFPNLYATADRPAGFVAANGVVSLHALLVYETF